jgi:hypothetical protein
MKKFKCEVYPHDELKVYIDVIDWEEKKGRFIAIDLENVDGSCVLINKKKAQNLIKELNKLIDKL